MTFMITETKLRAATSSVAAVENECLETANFIKHEFSVSFESKMKQIFQQAFGTTGIVKITFIYRQAIAIVAMIVFIVAIPFSVKAVRTAIFEFFENIYQEFSHYFFVSPDPTPQEFGLFEEYLPSFIPHGFVLVEEDHYELVFLHYQSDEDSIIYQQQRLVDFSMNLNTENISIDRFIYCGCEAQYFSNQGMQYLLWFDDEYCYLIISTLNRESILKIADSVPKMQ